MNGIVITFGCLIALVILVFVGLHLYAYGWIFFDGLKLRRLLRTQNRLLSLSEAKEKIKQKKGMIIVDAPTLGWNVSRVWWSPTNDFVLRPATWGNDRMCPVEDIQNYNKFVEPSTGIASLIDGFIFTQRAEAFLKRHFGSSDCGFIFSGGVQMQLQMEKKTQNLK